MEQKRVCGQPPLFSLHHLFRFRCSCRIPKTFFYIKLFVTNKDAIFCSSMKMWGLGRNIFCVSKFNLHCHEWNILMHKTRGQTFFFRKKENKISSFRVRSLIQRFLSFSRQYIFKILGAYNYIHSRFLLIKKSYIVSQECIYILVQSMKSAENDYFHHAVSELFMIFDHIGMSRELTL